MSIAVSVVSTIIKSAVNSKVGNELANELIGISVDDVSEKGISKINDFINNERTKIEKILSKEKMKSMDISEDNIAYAIAEVKGLFSEIEITDDIFRQCKYDSLKLCGFLWEKYSENKIGYIECESDIKKSLFAFSEALIKLMRESEAFVEDITIQISNTVDDTRIEIQRISDYLEENVGKISADNQRILDILREMLEQNQKSKMQKKSRTQEYADKWNANMFLNDFDKRDEKAGVNVKLREVYLNKHLPHYIWGNNEEKRNDLKELMIEYIEENDRNKMLLILGQPGIGKSTLITWITAHFTEKVDDILVYRFASDLKNIEWKSENITERILNELRLSNEELNEKILILDGYDEISVKDDRKEILDQLYWGVMKNNITKCFLLIVTCRVNYIKAVERVQCKYITLQPWDKEQIESFCKIFCRITNISLDTEAIENIIKNKEILGVPLILYMVLALNISIDKEGSIVDVYDKIFSLEGGIYDRCIDNKSFADRHRVGKMKQQIHQLSREIAIWMFENNPDEAYIPAEEYKKICVNILQQNEGQENDIEQDFIIGIFFELKHCEGEKSEELYFAHRSIYEYFVAESIFSSIGNSIRDLSVESQKEFMSNISFYLKQGKITYTIGEYLKCKFIKVYESLSVEKKKYFYEWWETVVSKMVENGMFYFENAKRKYKNIICKEITCFINLLELLRLVLVICKEKYLMKNVDREILEKYIKYAMIEYKITQKKKNSFDIFDLSNMCLKGIDLSGIDLIGINFSEADLGETDLSGLNLSDANLRGANLELANLEGTDLSKADLGRANLRGADLFCANLDEAFLMDAIIDNATFCRTEIEGSTWHKEDLEKIRSNLCGMDFTYIIQKDGGKRIKIYRKDICNIK